MASYSKGLTRKVSKIELCKECEKNDNNGVDYKITYTGDSAIANIEDITSVIINGQTCTIINNNS